MTRTSHRLAVAVAVIAWIGLAAQFTLSYESNNDVARTLWVLARYFTILTNLMVAVTFTWMAVTRRRMRAQWTAGVTLWILIVGVVYHTLLANYDKSGLDFIADHATHTVVPAFTAIWWVGFARHVRFHWRLAAVWLWWPLFYVIYVIGRGLSDGIYPYFFIDLSRFSVGTVLINSVGLCVAFWIAGLVMIAIARLRAS
jgi:uncharacterized protein YacL